MTRDQFNKYLETLQTGEYIVKILLKDEIYSNIRVLKEYLYYDGDNDIWVWANDWYEGEKYVDIRGIIDVNDIEPFNMLPGKEYRNEQY